MSRQDSGTGIIMSASDAADGIFVNLCKDYKVEVSLRSLTVPRRRFVLIYGNLLHNCLFCGRNEDDVEKYGEFIHSRSGISVHYFCLLFSSGLIQSGNKKTYDTVESDEAIYGFSIKDILEEFIRASKLPCGNCHKKGASIGCAKVGCSRKLHYPCGVEKHFLYQYFGSFPAYCCEHRPVQKLAISRTTLTDGDNPVCGICFDNIDNCISYDVLTTPCCKNSWIHRKCVEKQALSFGLYLFRCPLCNNKDDYIEEMKRMGIYIPQRDASWETPDAYTDLLESRQICDMSKCLCEHGRKHDKPGTIWSITACVMCGLSGAHYVCASLRSMRSPLVCDICKSVWGTKRINEKLNELGYSTENSMFTSTSSLVNNNTTTCNTAVETHITDVIESYDFADQSNRRKLRPRINSMNNAQIQNKRRKVIATEQKAL